MNIFIKTFNAINANHFNNSSIEGLYPFPPDLILLKDNGIDTLIHYPISIAKQKAYKFDKLNDLEIAEQISKEELSLPLYYGMTDEEVEYVIKIINNFKVE